MLNFQFILSGMYGFYTSYIVLMMITSGVGFNKMTIMVYLLNITITYVLYKVGGVIDRWLKQ